MNFYTTINQHFESYLTDSYLTFLHDKILKGFDKCLMNGIILIDFQKAFDTIDFDILMKKLIAIGFSNHTNSYFKSYLSNQLFRVNLENCCFQYQMQGTTRIYSGSFTLSHTLSHVYDKSQAVKLNLFLYAAGSCVVFLEKYVIEIEKQLNIHFTSIFDQFVDSRLSLWR